MEKELYWRCMYLPYELPHENVPKGMRYQLRPDFVENVYYAPVASTPAEKAAQDAQRNAYMQSDLRHTVWWLQNPDSPVVRSPSFTPRNMDENTRRIHLPPGTRSIEMRFGFVIETGEGEGFAEGPLRELQEVVGLADVDGNIGMFAFRGCSKLTVPGEQLSDQLKSIDSQAFYGCTQLNLTKLPDALTNVGHHAFAGCTSLELQTLPPNLTHVGQGAFERTKINVPRLPPKLYENTILESTFEGCTELQLSDGLPEGLRYIDRNAFKGCTSLDFTKGPPASLRMIHSDAFFGASAEVQDLFACVRRGRRVPPFYLRWELLRNQPCV